MKRTLRKNKGSLSRTVSLPLAVVFMSLVASASHAFQIDFQRRFQILEAERHFAQGKFVEARELFQRLGESGGSETESAALLARAAIALGNQEGQFESAMQEALLLEYEPARIYAIISLMTLQSDWTGIIERFGDITADEWAEVRLPARPRGSAEELRTMFFYKRGLAFQQTGNYERADHDLAAAADLMASQQARAEPNLLNLLSRLATLRANQLDDAEGAFEANKRIAANSSSRGNRLFFGGVLRAAAYLREQERFDEAIEMIQTMNPAQLNRDSDWFGNGMLALGRTYWAAGKLDEAEKTYAEILGSSILNPRFMPRAARYRAEVLKEAGRTNEALKAYRALLEMENIDADLREQATAAIKELANDP